MGVQTVFVSKRVVSPESFAQRIQSDNFSCVSCKGFEQSIFHGSERYGFTGFAHLTTLKINQAAIQFYHWCICFVAAAQDSMDAQQEFLPKEGLCNVIVRTQPQPLRLWRSGI